MFRRRGSTADERRRGRGGLPSRGYVFAAVAVLLVAAAVFAGLAAIRASGRTEPMQPGSLGRSAKTSPAALDVDLTPEGGLRQAARSAKRMATATVAPPAGTPAQPATIPEKMARMLPGSRQIIIVTGKHLGSNEGTLRVFNKEGPRWREVLATPYRAGTNGLTDGLTRHSGTRTTPTGIWYIGDFLFGQHEEPPAGTMMPYKHIDSDSWWSAEHDSTYNTWVQSSSHIDGEHLKGVTIQYEYAFSTGYNAPPNECVIGRGTAIFVHVFDPPDYNDGFSAGCVGIDRSAIIRVFQLLDPARKPTFAMGTEQAGTPTSIYSY